MNYIKVYNNLIQKSQAKNRCKSKKTYYEEHHIIPKCLGGTNEKSNLVLLTSREHFIAHLLLHYSYPNNNKLFFAINMMCNGCNRVRNSNKYKTAISSRMFEYLKLEMSKRTSGDNHYIRKNPEIKNKISSKLKGHIVSADTRNKISIGNQNKIPWNKGKLTGPMSVETKARMSIAKIGKSNGPMSIEQKRKLKDIQLAQSSSAKKINQIDKNGNIVATFKSIKEARSITGYSRILDSLKQRRMYVNGFKWEYAK